MRARQFHFHSPAFCVAVAHSGLQHMPGSLIRHTGSVVAMAAVSLRLTAANGFTAAVAAPLLARERVVLAAVVMVAGGGSCRSCRYHHHFPAYFHL